MSNLLAAAGHQEFVDEHRGLIGEIRDYIDALSETLGSAALSFAYLYGANGERSVSPIQLEQVMDSRKNPCFEAALFAVDSIAQTARRLYVDDIHVGLKNQIYTPEDIMRLRAPERRILPAQADWRRNELALFPGSALSSFASIKLFGKTGAVLASAHMTHLDDGEITRSFSLLEVHGDPMHLQFDLQQTSSSILLSKTVNLLGKQRGIPLYALARRTKTDVDLAMLRKALEELASEHDCADVAQEVRSLVLELDEYGTQSLRDYELKKLIGNEDGFPMDDELTGIAHSLATISR